MQHGECGTPGGGELDSAIHRPVASRTQIRGHKDLFGRYRKGIFGHLVFLLEIPRLALKPSHNAMLATPACHPPAAPALLFPALSVALGWIIARFLTRRRRRPGLPGRPVAAAASVDVTPATKPATWEISPRVIPMSLSVASLSRIRTVSVRPFCRRAIAVLASLLMVAAIPCSFAARVDDGAGAAPARRPG